MKQRLNFFGSYAIYGIGYFLFARLLFLLYEYSYSFNIPIKDWILSFTHGIRMDVSATGYILAVVGVLLVFTSFTNGRVINKIIKPFTIIVLTLTSIIVIVDLELYNNWGYRMDSTPLMYLANPKDAMASTKFWLEFFLVLLTIAYILLGLYIYNRKIKNRVLAIEKSKIFVPLFLLILTGSMIIPIRGSLGIAPMNSGMVYFSEKKFANHAAINVVWNFMNSLVYKDKNIKTYDFMNDEIAERLTNKLIQKQGEGVKILKKENPNVVLIILESFSSKVIKNLGGKWNAAPRLNELINEGVSFNNFYANGSRSDKGLVSILSGYPAQPTTSIMKIPNKTETLPSLFNTLNENDYKTYFYYGGDIDFANMRSYLLNTEAQRIISVEDFDSKLNNSKWGVHDEYIFDILHKDVVNHKAPYFKVVFTLSSHDPFEVPMDPVFEGKDRATQYLNSVYYTDSCLGKFFDQIKGTEAWDNTLFILVADHGSSRPGNSQNHDLDKFQIPMLWLGGVLNDSIKVVDKVSSQMDIPATLLNQLGISHNEFEFSKDLFSAESHEFAYYAYNDGFTFITDTSKVIFDNVAKELIYSEGNINQDLEKGKAFLQTVMNDFTYR